MRNFISIVLILFSNHVYGQIEAVVISSETKEIIPYVNIWIEGENIGTTSNLTGAFKLEIDTPLVLVFSAIGYKSLKISSKTISDSVELNPSIAQLDQVTITPDNQKIELVTASFKKKGHTISFGSGKTPWIIARYFPYQEIFSNTRFLKKVRILTTSDIKGAKFNLRILAKNGEIGPGKPIHQDNIIGISKKGKSMTEIDLSSLNIRIPEEGFFLAFEWLVIESNEHEETYTLNGSKTKLKRIDLEPKLGTVPSESNENIWIYRRGKWSNDWNPSWHSIKRYKDKYPLPAMELTLTN